MIKKISVAGFFHSGKNRVFPDLTIETTITPKSQKKHELVPPSFQQNYSKIAMVSDFLTNEEADNLLQKMIDILKPFASNKELHIFPDDAEQLSYCLDTFFTPITTFHMTTLQLGNSAAQIVTRGTDLLVLKEHRCKIPWNHDYNVICEMYMSLLLLQKFPNNDYFPNLVNINMNKSRVNIVTLFIPKSFTEIFTMTLPRTFIRKRVTELLSAVYFLHIDLLVAHRDIKSQNTRFKSNGQLVLIDFDTCCSKEDLIWSTRPVTSAHTRAPELEEINVNDGDDDDDKKTQDYDLQKGEKQVKPYNPYACDIFSCGCVILEMILSGQSPFRYKPEELHIRLQQIKQFATSKTVQTHVEEKAGKECFDLLTKMLSYNPCERPTINDCLLHPYITETCHSVYK